MTVLSFTRTPSARGTPRPHAARTAGRAAPPAPVQQPEQAGRSLRVILRIFWRRHRSRMALARMSAHLLKDIGLTRAEAEHEANKPFWRS